MANLIMTNWYIKDKTPYIVIGTAGENNATSISIECDEIIENAEYFLDIGDSKNDIFNTQELTVKQQTTPTGETTNILYLKPMRSFLGKEGVKLLQVRCEYIDNDEKITKESNVFHAVVNKNTGFSYKFDIAIFQQYLNKVKELATKIAQAISNMTLEELKDTNIVDPTDGQIIKYDAETQKWINGEGGGSGGSSNYNELSNKPKINNVVLSGNKTTSDLGINIPTKTSDLTNDSNFVADVNYVHTDNNYTNADKTIVNGVTSALASKANSSDLASVAISGDYDDLINKPSIPSVSVTQVLESGTKIAEINVDGTTTNIFAPNGGEKEIVHVTELPEPPNIEDKIYEFSEEFEPYDLDITFPSSGATIKEIEDYFNDFSELSQLNWELPSTSTLTWGVKPSFKMTFIKDGAPVEIDIISFRNGNYVIINQDGSQTFQPSTVLSVQVEEIDKDYYLGNSVYQTTYRIPNYFETEEALNVIRLERLLNVNIADLTLQNNDVLAYNATSNRWKNKPMTSVAVTQTLQSGTKIGSISVDGTSTDLFAPESAPSLSDLSDTSISSPSSGDVLVFDGEKWENNVIEGLERENKFDSLSFTPLAKVIDKNSGNLVEASNGQALVISNPTEGDVYRITGAYFGTGALYCIYYQNHSKTIYPATNTGKLGYLPIIETIILTIPANVEELRISSRSYDLKVEKQTNDIVYKIPEKHNDNVLYGKKWAVCGDSYTVGNFEGYVDPEGHTGENSDAFDKKQMRYKTYPWWIGNRNNMKVQWLAYGGKDFTNISGAYYPFSDSESDKTYYNYTMIDPDCDYVTLMFGLNEANLTAEQIGTSADTTNETLWGAYYVVLSAIFTANPTVKIGIIIEDSYMNETYATALKAIAKYWGIPCLDIKGDENVSMMLGGKFYTHSSVAENIKNDTFRVSANNSHPNVKAHEYRSTVIENFLRTL